MRWHALQGHVSASCISRWRALKAVNAPSRASSTPAALSREATPPSAKTASPSISWISSGGERCATTSSSSAAMIWEPCSSSVVVTNAVNPDTSASTRNP